MLYKIVFLDIDGVLNDCTAHENHYYGIKKECVNNFNLILGSSMDIKIVISSAWRYIILEGSMTVAGFETMLLTHGINCNQKIIGYTESDEKIKERSEQIANWVINNNVQKYVVLDDLELNIPNFIKTDSNTGLTLELAKRAIKILI